jgi:hypothetical protein
MQLSRLRDIGFIPLLLAGIGGLSILSIVETVVRRDNLFVAPVRALLEGYKRLESLAESIFEPVLGPLIAWLGDFIDFPLALQPHWRPLFILGLTIGGSLVSVGWRSTDRWGAARLGGVLAIAALVGAAIAGAVPPEAGEFAQGVVAAMAVIPLVLGLQWGPAFGALLRGDREHFRGMLRGSVQFAAAIGVLAFIAATVLGSTTLFRRDAAVVALGLGVLLFGSGLALIGAVLNRPEAGRLGLRIVSGFIAAIAILIANAVMKTPGA